MTRGPTDTDCHKLTGFVTGGRSLRVGVLKKLLRIVLERAGGFVGVGVFLVSSRWGACNEEIGSESITAGEIAAEKTNKPALTGQLRNSPALAVTVSRGIVRIAAR